MEYWWDINMTSWDRSALRGHKSWQALTLQLASGGAHLPRTNRPTPADTPPLNAYILACAHIHFFIIINCNICNLQWLLVWKCTHTIKSWSRHFQQKALIINNDHFQSFSCYLLIHCLLLFFNSPTFLSLLFQRVVNSQMNTSELLKQYFFYFYDTSV